MHGPTGVRQRSFCLGLDLDQASDRVVLPQTGLECFCKFTCSSLGRDCLGLAMLALKHWALFVRRPEG